MGNVVKILLVGKIGVMHELMDAKFQTENLPALQRKGAGFSQMVYISTIFLMSQYSAMSGRISFCHQS
jgi:hypothetical protein